MTKISGITSKAVTITGVSPLLMHNSQLANPLSPWTQKIKAITSKHHSKKTENDIIETMRLEFQGGLYYDDKTGPYIPAEVIEGCIRDAAKAKRQGKAIIAGVQVDDHINTLIYDGPRGRDELYDDKRYVDVRPVKLQGNSTIMRTRPLFQDWSCKFVLTAIDDLIDFKSVLEFLEYGGKVKAVGDYRPKFGRFIIK